MKRIRRRGFERRGDNPPRTKGPVFFPSFHSGQAKPRMTGGARPVGECTSTLRPHPFPQRIRSHELDIAARLNCEGYEVD